MPLISTADGAFFHLFIHVRNAFNKLLVTICEPIVLNILICSEESILPPSLDPQLHLRSKVRSIRGGESRLPELAEMEWISVSIKKGRF